MKILTARTHEILDYVAVAALALGPTLFGYSGWAATASYVLAAVHLLLTLGTDFPLGVVKKIPFSIHGAIELGVAAVLLLAPWFVAEPERGRAHLFSVGMGIGFLIIWFLTDYRPARVVAAPSANFPPPAA